MNCIVFFRKKDWIGNVLFELELYVLILRRVLFLIIYIVNVLYLVSIIFGRKCFIFKILFMVFCNVFYLAEVIFLLKM